MNERILQKLAHHPVLRDTVLRVRQVGLHKVAAQLHDMREVTLQSAVQKIGTDLYKSHLKHKQIEKGLDAYRLIEKL